MQHYKKILLINMLLGWCFVRAEGPLPTPMPSAPSAGELKSQQTQIPPKPNLKHQVVEEGTTKKKKSTPKKTNATLPSLDADVNYIVYDRTPVRILLKPERERILHFENSVTLHAPPELKDQMRFDVIEKSVFLTAASTFGVQRIIVEDLTTNRMIPIDLISVKSGMPAYETEIRVKNKNGTSVTSSTSLNDKTVVDKTDDGSALDIIELTRFASQNIYSPKRLIPQIDGVRSVRVDTNEVKGLYRNSLVQTNAIAAWRTDELFVTAVKFSNLSQKPVELDLDELRGNWIAATAQHGRLLEKGKVEDTTVVYLISIKSFEASR